MVGLEVDLKQFCPFSHVFKSSAQNWYSLKPSPCFLTLRIFNAESTSWLSGTKIQGSFSRMSSRDAAHKCFFLPESYFASVYSNSLQVGWCWLSLRLIWLEISSQVPRLYCYSRHAELFLNMQSKRLQKFSHKNCPCSIILNHLCMSEQILIIYQKWR